MNFPTSQTPPPPSPYPSPTPSAAEPSGPGLSEAQRLINTFIAPKKTFEDLKRNSSWWVPWLISAVFALIFGIVAVQKIDMARFVQQQIDRSPSAQRRMEQATPEQRAQGMAIQATGWISRARINDLSGKENIRGRKIRSFESRDAQRS